jgi:esterase/lipase superfamily enzyme
MRLRRGMRMLTLVLLLAAPAAPAQDLFELARVEALAAENPAAALEQLDRMLQALAADPAADPRLLHDLTRFAADLLAAEGRKLEAAAQYRALADLVARNRQLDIDPIPLLRLAAEQSLAAGDLRGALGAETALLAEQRAGGLPGPDLAPTMERLAALSRDAGDAAGAAQWTAAAAAARNPVEIGARGPGEGFRRIKVYYATDRARTGQIEPTEFYGGGRGTLDYGQAEVTVPDSHVAGSIESPSIWKLEFGPDAARHVMLRSVEPLDKASFFSNMQADLADRPRSELVVFIHGFNVTFDAAAKRAAQLAHDMNYDGVPVLYSWPSRGSTMGYISDTASVQVSARRLSGFLDELVTRSGATTIHLVAHSMGNRALTEALELLALRHPQAASDPPPFDQVVFAAPDVDAGLFAEILPTIRPLARRMTLYASENDWALVASRKLHGDAPRAGQGGADMLADPDIDSVDMSELGEDMLAHGYFAEDSSALVDLATIFWRNIAPARRCGLEAVAHAAGPATWVYEPGACPDNALLAVLSTLQQAGVETPAAASQTMEQMALAPEVLTEVEPVVIKLMSN